MKLDDDLEPLPVDSTFLVRPRSALGLKYVELTPGDADGGLRRRAPSCRSSRPRPSRSRSTRCSTPSTSGRGAGAQASLNGFGEGLAGRGQSLNEAIEELSPLLEDLEPVARNLADPEHPARPHLRASWATPPARWRRWPSSRPRCS